MTLDFRLIFSTPLLPSLMKGLVAPHKRATAIKAKASSARSILQFPGMNIAVIIVAILGFANAKIFFKESFEQNTLETKWIQSKAQKYGTFEWTCGKFCIESRRKGIKTSQDSKFYALSAKFEPFSNKDDTLIVQYTVRHEQNLDCGGGYIKVIEM